ncbi:hypothetical protein Q3G72_026833 [Acer saccharum]|nr:hypothetical protein Q3G72_026833 [Acer saccharum]
MEDIPPLYGSLRSNICVRQPTNNDDTGKSKCNPKCMAKSFKLAWFKRQIYEPFGRSGEEEEEEEEEAATSFLTFSELFRPISDIRKHTGTPFGTRYSPNGREE